MNDRIEINGVWYVREDAKPTPKQKPIEVEYNFSEECHVETDKYFWVVSRLKKEDGTFYDDITVTMKDKRNGHNYTDWKEYYYDNMNWFIGVMTGNAESMESLKELVPEPDEREVFIKTLMKVESMGWFNVFV